MGSPVFGLLALAQDWWPFLFNDHCAGVEEPVLVVVVAVWCRAGSSLHGCKAPVSRFGSASSGSGGFKLGEVGLQSHDFCPEEAADFLHLWELYRAYSLRNTEASRQTASPRRSVGPRNPTVGLSPFHEGPATPLRDRDGPDRDRAQYHSDRGGRS